MNRPIFTLLTGTPTARALAALPPTAKIQLPTCVRSRIHVATRTKTIHQSTVARTVTPPTSNCDEKTVRADPNPSMSETFCVATVPVMSFVTPRLMPKSMKNVLSVTRKLGMPVRTTR